MGGRWDGGAEAADGASKLAEDGRPIPSKRLWPLKHMSQKKKKQGGTSNQAKAVGKGAKQATGAPGFQVLSILVLAVCILFVPLFRYTNGLEFLLAYVADAVAKG